MASFGFGLNGALQKVSLCEIYLFLRKCASCKRSVFPSAVALSIIRRKRKKSGTPSVPLFYIAVLRVALNARVFRFVSAYPNYFSFRSGVRLPICSVPYCPMVG
jgi:hypothetical protein